MEQKAAEAALSMLVDTIVTNTSSYGLPMLDLRTVMRDEKDWANPIEPSNAGGQKIAASIAKVLLRDPTLNFTKTSLEVKTSESKKPTSLIYVSQRL
uniref:Uncharacterized protein n=1 Tax=Amorphochlora amoebiformis TaxID=1561963 RepID=A0A7S0D531_9EUKA